jgi:SAM-dependent methyltransferase
MLHVYTKRHDPELFQKKGCFLHYAPEVQVRDMMKDNKGLRYAPTDLGLDRLRPIAEPAFQSNILAIPMADGVVDVSFCIHLLEHLLDDTKGIAELYRVMRPGAILYVMVPIDLHNSESVFFGKPHPDIFDHYWSYARDFRDKLAQFEYQEIEPRDFLSTVEAYRFGVPDQEIIFRCVKPGGDKT